MALHAVLGEVGEVVGDVGTILGRVHGELVAEVVELLVDVGERRLGVLGALGVVQVADRLAELLAVALGRVLLAAAGGDPEGGDGEGGDDGSGLGHGSRPFERSMDVVARGAQA